MGLINNNKNIVLRLELKGELLYEIRYQDVTSEIIIGRSNDCTWHIPATDKYASNHHARIFRKKNSLFIADADSKNGIFLRGQKIAQHKISVDEQYSIGECQLFVERAKEDIKSIYSYHRLEQLNGADKGRVYNIDKNVFIIGSAANCDIVICDQVISSQHLKIVTQGPRDLWVQDMGSSNGSSVNGEPLKYTPKKTENKNSNESSPKAKSEEISQDARMLKDGDIISAAYIEMRFLDKHVEHVRSHIFLKIAAVVVTVAVLLGGYFSYLMLAPTAKTFVRQARMAATNRNFDAALAYLEKAQEAEGADIHRFEISELREQINKWKETMQKWQKVRQLLVDLQWLTANHELSPLVGGNLEFWRWNNTDASAAKNEALKTKRFLDIFLQSRAELMSNEATLASLKEAHRRLAAELANHTGSVPEHIAALRKWATDTLEELDKTCKCWETIVKNIDALKRTYNMQEALKNITQAQKEMKEHQAKRQYVRISPRIIPFANEYLLPLKGLSEAQRILDNNYVYCAQLKFEKIVKELPLPGINECNIDPVLSDMRRTFIVLNEQLFANAKQLRNIVLGLIRQDLVPGKKPEAIRQLYNSRILEAVLRCDTFDYPIVTWNRKAGVGEYDKMLGLEVFFDYMRALPDDFDTSKLGDLKFRPVLFTVRECYAQLKAFLAFTEQKNMVMICNNQCSGNLVAEWILYADDMLNERKRFVQQLTTFSNATPDRRGIIAGGIALLLDDTLSRDTRFVTALSKKVKNNRRMINDILRNTHTPEAVIKARKQVLQLGLPGDSLLKHPWAEYYKKK